MGASTTDWDSLAAQAGATPYTPPAPEPPKDWDALAQASGAVRYTAPSGGQPMDWDKLATQAGAAPATPNAPQQAAVPGMPGGVPPGPPRPPVPSMQMSPYGRVPFNAPENAGPVQELLDPELPGMLHIAHGIQTAIPAAKAFLSDIGRAEMAGAGHPISGPPAITSALTN